MSRGADRTWVLFLGSLRALASRVEGVVWTEVSRTPLSELRIRNAPCSGSPLC